MTPDHGTRARYLRGCRCDACSAAHRRYCKAYKYRTACKRKGGPTRPIRVDAAPVIAHLERLRASGMTRSDIVRESGQHESTLRYLSRGLYATVHARIAAAVLAVEPLPDPEPDLVDEVAVERVLAAVADARTLSASERREAIRRALARGRTRQWVEAHIRASGSTIRRALEEAS